MFGFGKKKQETKVVYVTGCEFNCRKKECPKWVVMFQHVKNEDGTEKTIEDGRCYAAWIPFLFIEQVNRIVGTLEKLGDISGDKA